jgi:putative membrane protein
MAKFIGKTLVTTLAVLFASYLLKGVSVDSAYTALMVAIVLGLLNNFIKPLLIILTIPITIFTLGLFLFVINILIVKWASDLVTGFYVSGWWAALWFSIVVSFTTSFIESLIGSDQQKQS